MLRIEMETTNLSTLIPNTASAITQKLAEVADVSVRMEVNGVSTRENIEFASLLEKCSCELSDISEYLLSAPKKITKADADFESLKPKHEHWIDMTPVITDLTYDVKVDDDHSILPITRESLTPQKQHHQ